MIPVLYDQNEKDYLSIGIGALTDTLSAIITEERNGVYELVLTYHIDGVWYNEIKHGRQILAKSNETARPQPFRIYKISKPINGVATINAEHISYKLNGVPVAPFSAMNVQGALTGIKTHSAIDNEFTFASDKTTSGSFNVRTPNNVRQILGGIQGSILDTYGGGEYEFDRYNVMLWQNRGKESGVVIEYGKNLVDVTQEELISNVITGIYPYWVSENDYLDLPEKVVHVEKPLVSSNILNMDFSQDFAEKPTTEELRKSAQTFLNTTKLTEPTVNIKVSFVQLWQTEKYKNDPFYKQIRELEQVSLCDIVKIKFIKLGVDVKAKIIKITFDSLTEKYVSMEIGEPKTNLSKQLAEQQKEIENKPSLGFLEKAILDMTNAITGNTGGYVVLDPPQQPQRILIMDKPDKTTAQRVWQWNLNGLAYSKTGIDGEYTVGINMNGAIVADLITAGTLNAANITVVNLTAESIVSGILSSRETGSKFDLGTGEIVIDADNCYVRISAGGIYFVDKETMTEFNSWEYSAESKSSNLTIDGVTLRGTSSPRVLYVDALTNGSGVTANDINAMSRFIFNGTSMSKKTVEIDGTTINYMGW